MRSDKFYTYVEKHPVAQRISAVLLVLGGLWFFLIGPIVLNEMGFFGTDMFMLPWMGNAFLYQGLGWIIGGVFKEHYRGEIITNYFSIYQNDNTIRVEVKGRTIKGELISKKKWIPYFIKERKPKAIQATMFCLPDEKMIYSVGVGDDRILFLNDTIIMEYDRIYYDRIDKIYGVKKATPVIQQNVETPVTPVYAQTPVVTAKEQASVNNGFGLTTPIVAQKKNDAYILTALEGQFAGQKWELEKSVMLGRDANCCQIVFAADTAGVSRVHCEVGCKDGSLYIRDLGSSYGTTLENGQVVNNYQEVKLESGDTFLVSANDKFMVMKN